MNETEEEKSGSASATVVGASGKRYERIIMICTHQALDMT